MIAWAGVIIGAILYLGIGIAFVRYAIENINISDDEMAVSVCIFWPIFLVALGIWRLIK